MSNALAIMPFEGLTEHDIVTVRETIAKDCNDSQFRLFMGIAKAAGANPVLGEIHPSVFQGKLTVQFGIDFFVRKAKETEGYLGYDVQLVHENDVFKMRQARAEDGRYYAVIEEHSWGFPRGRIIGGYAIAYKEGLAPFTVVMDIEEVIHYQKSDIGMQKRMWTNQLPDMFKKHMAKRALKAAFGLRFDGDDDRPLDATPDGYGAPPQRRDITDEANASSSQQQPPASQPEPNNENDKMDELRKQMNAKFRELGITGRDAKSEYIASKNVVKGETPTLQELTKLVKLMEVDIANKATQASDEDELP
ncbi:MAG: recombinase RecT [Cohnella sp.]|nr:recombinase RecT [Cohnella sp.]